MNGEVPQSTCDGEKCKLWQLLDGCCPNYIENWWTKPGKKPALVKDCAPKRSLMMLQDIHNAFVSSQQAFEKFRNECIWVQVAAEVVGKAAGVDLRAFVLHRQQLEQQQKQALLLEEVEKIGEK